MRTHRVIITICITGALAGCAATQQASEVEESGFLGSETYALLEPGREGETARLVYVNEDVDFSDYDKIILEPVTFWTAPGTELAPPEDRKMLANATFATFHEQLSKDYEIVREPGPGTMTMALAITDAEQTDAALNTVSSIVPQARLLRGAASFVTEKPAFVGEAAGEAKITDSMTGELLAAGVDRRFGAQRVEVSTDSWEDALDIIEYWSQLVRYQLCRERGDPDCAAPEV